MKKTILLAIVFLLALPVVEAQDVIVKTDGQEIETKVYEILPDMIKYKKHSNPSGPMYSIYVHDVARIIFENGEEEVFTVKEKPAEPLEEEAKEEINTYVDPRDKQTYHWVKIGTQVWMVENINFNLEKGSWSHRSDPENQKKYGRIYNWKAAVKACPPGWHLPSISEWRDLYTSLGGDYVAGEALKASSGWAREGNGTNESGFSALPCGARNILGTYFKVGKHGCWWSSTNTYNETYEAYTYEMRFNEDRVRRFSNDKDFGFSVRCVKD